MTDLNLALGAMYFGTRVDEATSFALLDRFVDAGGSIVDTADCYAFWMDPSSAGGHSESVIGRWLARRPSRRESVYLSTKTGAQPDPGSDRRQGLSVGRVRAAMDASLRRLGTDRVDIYWAHLEDRDLPLDEIVATFAELADDGRAIRLGMSNHPAWRVERARRLATESGSTPFSAMQLSYSYLQPRPLAPVDGQEHRFGMATDEALDYVVANADMWLWAYSPLLHGSYVRPDRPFAEAYDHPGTTRRLAVLGEVAEEIGVTRNQVVLAWLVGGQPPITPVVGVSTAEQLDEAMAGASIVLTDDQRKRLDDAA